MISITPYSDEARGLWDAFVSKCKNATFLHSRNYMDYHKDRFVDNSLMIYHEDRLSGLFVANRKDERTVVSHEGLTYGGLLVEHDEYTDITMNFFAEVLKYYHESGVEQLLFKQIPSFYTNVPCNDIEYALFLAEASLYRVDINSVIDMKLEKRIPLQRRRKTGIKMAEKNRVQVEEMSDFDEFWNQILIPNLQQRHAAMPVHTLDEMRQLHVDNPGRIRQFNARYDGRIMAGCTIFDFGHVVRLQYFSGCDEGRANGSLDLLVYKLMTDYFSDRRYLDFGNSNIANGKKLNNGLLGWKEGFGARSFVQRFYQVDTKRHSAIAEAFT